jgi:hypothetical protein
MERQKESSNSARKKPLRYLNKFSSLKLKEIVVTRSPPEHDYLFLLEADSGAIRYRSQPGPIFFSFESKRHRYTPDFLVFRRNKIQIIEVKPEKRLVEDWNSVLFAMATRACREREWEFTVVSDTMIRRQPRLDNLKLLYKYAGTQLDSEHQISSISFLSSRRITLLGELLDFFVSRKLPTQAVYALIFRGVIAININLAISVLSQVWLPQVRREKQNAA